ncbi:hypothetical protein OB905_13180 [Halobacteria archaeon AArc-dxtr1]|nr:hypothetical protein [Halobacteria archaeon AArc-dxtr1]
MDRAQTSLPYMLLLGAVSFVLMTYLYVVLDPVVTEIVGTSAWQDGSEETMAGRERLLAMWDVALILGLTGIGLTILWASRRGV